MDSFSMNSARSFLGKNVNLHLKDGSVIVNVQLADILKDEFQRKRYVMCAPSGNKVAFKIPLKSVAWAEMLNPNIIPSGG